MKWNIDAVCPRPFSRTNPRPTWTLPNPKIITATSAAFMATTATSISRKQAARLTVNRQRPVWFRTKIVDTKTYPRVSRDAAHYVTEIHGQKYTLLFGDLHKHSNISRCSTGNEPSPDDHYKYSHDICQYDFLCMSDHAEHTTDFNWWRIQKLADLYNVPGYFSVLYGYEWTATWPVGHHNVIWAEKPAPILRHSLEGTHTLEGFGQPWTRLVAPL